MEYGDFRMSLSSSGGSDWRKWIDEVLTGKELTFREGVLIEASSPVGADYSIRLIVYPYPYCKNSEIGFVAEGIEIVATFELVNARYDTPYTKLSESRRLDVVEFVNEIPSEVSFLSGDVTLFLDFENDFSTRTLFAIPCGYYKEPKY